MSSSNGEEPRCIPVGPWEGETQARRDGVCSSSNNLTIQKTYGENGITEQNKEMVVTSHEEKIASPDMKHVVSYGPWGGNGGMIFDDGVYSGIREIHLTRYGGIISFRVCYDLNDTAVLGNKNGGTTGLRAEKVVFDYPKEKLIHISGYYGPTILRGPIVVKSLTFHTNKGKHGPFGEEQGNPFSSEVNSGRIIVGFHGRSGWLLGSIGVHVLKLKPHLSSNSFYISSTDQGMHIPSPRIGMVKGVAPAPWGGEGGKPWNDGVFSAIKKIYLVQGDSAIHCIQIQYDKHGQSLWSARHGGGMPGKSNLIKLDYPSEYLTNISGYYNPFTENEHNIIVVKSLTFFSNLHTYGPFGEGNGASFTTPKGKIVGFYGRNNSYLTAIGVHMQPAQSDSCEKVGSIKTLIHKFRSPRN